MPVSHNRDNNDCEPEPVSPPGAALTGLLGLSGIALRLKQVPRTGWLDRGVDRDDVESVADHSYGVALLAWVLAGERQAQGAAVDPQRVLALALLHDLAEAETGDMTPYDPNAMPELSERDERRVFLDRRHVRDSARTATKRAAEDAAMSTLITELPGTTRQRFSAIWQELRLGESAEARFVKQVDRLETFLQSLRYQESDPELPIDSFRLEVLETIDDPLLAELRDAALASWRASRD